MLNLQQCMRKKSRYENKLQFENCVIRKKREAMKQKKNEHRIRADSRQGGWRDGWREEFMRHTAANDSKKGKMRKPQGQKREEKKGGGNDEMTQCMCTGTVRTIVTTGEK